MASSSALAKRTACRRTLAAASLISAVWWCAGPLGGVGTGGGSPAELFNWHPVLMVLAFPVAVLEAAAVFAYRPLTARTRPARKQSHAALHGAAAVVAAAGLAVVVRFHALIDAPNWYSAHSWAGLAVLVALAAQYAVAFGAFLYPGATPAARVALVPVHREAGHAVAVGGVVACLLGVQDKQRLLPPGDVRDAAHVGAGLVTLLLLGTLVAFLAEMREAERAKHADAVSPGDRVASRHLLSLSGGDDPDGDNVE